MATVPIAPVQPVAPTASLRSPASPAPAAAPAFSYRPPTTRLALSKDELDYRGELIKQSVEYAKTEQAWRTGLMSTWSTRQIALAGLEAQLGKALIGAETDFAMAGAVALGGRAQMIASYREKLKNMAGAQYFAPNMDAVDAYEKSLKDTGSALSTAVTNSSERLDEMEAASKQFVDPAAQDEALYKQFSEFNDLQLDMEARRNNVSKVIGDTAKSQQFDTTVELFNRLGGEVHQAFDGDPRYSKFVDRYLDSKNNEFIAASKLDENAIKQGIARHAEGTKDDAFILGQIKSAFTASGLSPGLVKTLGTIVGNGEAALAGDPVALSEMTAAIPTPAGLAKGQELIDRELARMDGGGDPIANARNQFIKAFNDRAGRGDAFMVWANAMGFKGRGALDRAVNFGANNPSMVAQFADAVKADPTVVAPTGGYQSAKATLEALDEPTGPMARVARLHRPPVKTPAEVQQATTDPGANSIPFLEGGDAAPRIAPPTPAPAPVQDVATPAVAPVAPVPADAPGVPRNRVEMRPDGSLVAVHPDGSETILSPATAPVPAPAPAPTPDITWQPADISVAPPASAQVAAQFARPKNITWQPADISVAAPEVAPSDIPGTADQQVQWAPTDFAAMLRKQKIDELRQSVGR